MKGIMFNETYGLETAVLNRIKTRTWREDAKPRYKLGEIVAIKMSYGNIYNYDMDCLIRHGCILEDGSIRTDIFSSAGWSNKLYVKNELMPSQIKITSVKKCRLQDLTDNDCIKEGVRKYESCQAFFVPGINDSYHTAKNAFANLIVRITGQDDYWERNPMGYAYEFELIK